jgi:integrase/recombinase XerD
VTHSLTHECPSSGKLGRSISLVGFIQRFFSIPKEFIAKLKNNKRITLKKSGGSNSEYHLTLKQVNKIIAACQNERDAVLIQIMAFTGIRRAEVASLRIEDVNWDEKLLTIRNGKGHKYRLVPVPGSIFVQLRSLISQRTSGPIFQGRAGCTLSCRQVNRIVANIGRKTKVNNPNPKYTNITCHLFRHTFARLWKDMNGSIESLSRILGHSSVKTTWDLYGTEGINDIKKNYESIIRKIENSE